ncbi:MULTISPECIES: carbonic anhydrase [unclassified Thiomonas]|jgi:carbonic anhydrase|uniref:carbonic anhydrase n=1 Tax=unclassified Thiomonas TaxID=2625466 RepID=UPI0004DBA6BB|nr:MULTISPECIES: carbonic anhydrase [unclassified Thiomonas]CDW94515.1 Carbonic anhydrase [Thiomonas sp. CB2]VDY04325.1 Carbonic anhydrase [Thiomonas sp. Bio17B3]VDY08501.1 Carbonic anhydrase [Thiomonas sp. Sup16B3]VDY12571.1 Carbonic anhydrase [Thiomonas sp. OC7]VDY18217.1 Carbonic anhydrase [Thiomonas sp. CB2]
MYSIFAKTLLAAALLLTSLASGAASPAASPTHPDLTQIKGAIQHVLTGNDQYVKGRAASSFAARIAGQHPTATVVSCSDSRVQAEAIDEDPEGDLFMVREIGNQMVSGEGSVEYGVRHLHTPLLLIVGHSSCGAVKAAMGNYADLEPAIKSELDTLKVTKGNTDDAQAVKRNVEQNVNEQVKVALKKFAAEVKDGKLAVIGAVYDFRNDYGQGHGRLVFVNVNGTTDPAQIKTLLQSYRR